MNIKPLENAHRCKIYLTDVTQRRRRFPSWEGQGVGCHYRGVFLSATHPHPLPGGRAVKFSFHAPRGMPTTRRSAANGTRSVRIVAFHAERGTRGISALSRIENLTALLPGGEFAVIGSNLLRNISYLIIVSRPSTFGSTFPAFWMYSFTASASTKPVFTCGRSFNIL